MIQELNGSPLEEIKSKLDFWHERLEGQLSRFNTHADMWRLLRPSRSDDLSGFSNPQLSETTRATEALATFIYRALTSANPNFQLLSKNPMTSQVALWQSESVIQWQLRVLQYNRKLLRALRSCALFGTVGIEQPWVECPGYYQGTDFVPRSLLQIAFDPLAMDISASSWHASIDFISSETLRQRAKEMPDVYDPAVIEEATRGGKEKSLPPEILARLAAAGYLSYTGGGNGGIHYVTTYYGPLQDNPAMRDWCVGIIDDAWMFRAHESSYKRRNFEFAHLNEFEMEPYGYGVGRIGEAMQPEMNSNRGRMHDTITYSLLNMWIADRMSNIKTSQLKVRPWGVVEVDGGTKGLEPIRPQLEGVNFGILLEKLMKEEFRSTSGASDGLQAMVTEATATESSIAQNEAVRRVSVIAENIADPLLRRHISKMHENNLEFLDQPFWVASTGQGKPPMRIYPGMLAQEVEVITKVITDKDFRPQRNKDILQLLQILTSIRNDHPEIGFVKILPWVGELARGVGMNPADVIRPNPILMPGPSAGGSPGRLGGVPGAAGQPAMEQIGGMLQAANAARANAGALGQEAQQQMVPV